MMTSSISHSSDLFFEIPSSSTSKKTTVSKMTRCLFLMMREGYFVFTLSFSSLKWIHQNRPYQIAFPIFWKKNPITKQIISTLLNLSPDDLDLEEIVNCYAAKKKLDKKNLAKHFSSLIKNKGSCYGECIALLEQIQQDPTRNLQGILEDLFKNPTRIYYFQVLEIVRGLFDSFQSFHQDLATLAEKQKSLDDQSIHQKVITLFIPADQLLSLKFSSAHRDSRCEITSQTFSDVLRQEQNAAMIISGWHTGKTSHTFLYYCYPTQNSYGFYNSIWAGIYQYPNVDKLIECFTQHLIAFYSAESHQPLHYTLEIYR